MLWITGAKGLLGSALCAQCKAGLHSFHRGSCIAALHCEEQKQDPLETSGQDRSLRSRQDKNSPLSCRRVSGDLAAQGPPTNVGLGDPVSLLPYVATGREMDIADENAIRAFARQHPGITHIINAAAFSLVDPAEERREEAYRSNVVGPENLARFAQEIGARLIHISTDYVFPGTVKRPLTEEDPVGPCNYYGETKLEGERRALALSACVIRVSWLFGHGGKNFVSKLLELLLTQKEIKLTNDQWNRPTYVPDFAAAILPLLDQEGLYQYANAGVATKYEFGLAMREEAIRLGYPVVTESLIPVSSSAFASPCKRPVYSAFDTTKIEHLVPIRPWREALRDFLCAQQPVCL